MLAADARRCAQQGGVLQLEFVRNILQHRVHQFGLAGRNEHLSAVLHFVVGNLFCAFHALEEQL